MRSGIFASVISGILAFVSVAQAEQSGMGHYVSGATASFADALPDQSGWVWENIYLYYNGTYKTARGLPYGESIALDVDATANAVAPLIMYTLPHKVLDGHLAFATAIPYVWMNVNAKGTIGADGISHPVNQTSNADGLGDIVFWPFMLGWNHNDIKYDVRLGVYTPTGEYDKSKLANPGLGYWTFEPELTFSWLSSKIGTEFSVFTGVDFNTVNNDANYQSGNIFHIDSTIAQHLPFLGGSIGFGANGFWYYQITGDSGKGAKLGSFKANACGVGPVLSYVHDIGKSQMVFEAKWLPQLNADNTTKGNYVWVKLAVLF